MRPSLGVRIERAQMLSLLREQIDRPLKRFAMDARVGDGVEPHHAASALPCSTGGPGLGLLVCQAAAPTVKCNRRA
jgi:hypothetical protein